jgi:hypothetical protein
MGFTKLRSPSVGYEVGRDRPRTPLYLGSAGPNWGLRRPQLDPIRPPLGPKVAQWRNRVFVKIDAIVRRLSYRGRSCGSTTVLHICVPRG